MARKDVQACEIGYPALKNEQNRCLMLKYKHKFTKFSAQDHK